MSLILSSRINKVFGRMSMPGRFTNVGSRAGNAALLAAVLAGAGLNAHQAYAADAIADGTATVMTPISISKVTDLRFGQFSALTGGTVVISTAGARSATSAVVLSALDAGGAASFTVTGEADATYGITLPADATITHTVDGVTTMSIDSLTSDPSGTGTLTAGTQALAVGGTLTVGNAQEVGSYTGTLSVSVEYN